MLLKFWEVAKIRFKSPFAMCQKVYLIIGALADLRIGYLTAGSISFEIESMNPLFKSRAKKILVAAICLGILAAFLFGGAAWNHNPQDEFHIDGVATSDFYVLLVMTFGLVAGAALLVSLPTAYFFSRSPNKS